MAKLPVGEVWPRAPGTTLYAFMSQIALVWARWAQRVAKFLLVEAFPPTSLDLLPDWERVLGLPEPCIPVEGLTVSERQLAVREKLARRPGGQSREYFTGIAIRLGYHEPGPSAYQFPATLPMPVGRALRITITEYRPFMFGVSRLGDPRWRFSPPEMRFVWRVTVPGPRVTWFRFGAGRLGQDPHARIRQAEDLECLLHKLKPAHTRLIISYTGS
jgi:uncharacterized protein YmfQ (DUF2313 family)